MTIRTRTIALALAATVIPAVVNRLQGANIVPVSLTLTQPTLDDTEEVEVAIRPQPALNR